MKYHVIINPASAGGKTDAVRDQILCLIERQIGDNYTVCVTAAPMDALRSAAEAATAGCTDILVVGGDGTINEVVNGILAAGPEHQPSLGIISSGTGQGLALSLGLPRSFGEQVRCAVLGTPTAIDAARLSYINAAGASCHRFFVNECQIGFGAEVVRRTAGRRKRAGGLLAYGLRAFTLLFAYKPSGITVTIDGLIRMRQDALGVSIGNGAITAGGMRLTPDALLDDGTLDLLLICRQPLLRRVHSFAQIYAGRHTRMPGFRYARGQSIFIGSEEPLRVAADGELLGTVPCSIEIAPAAIRIRSTIKTQEKDNAARVEEAEAVGI